MKPLSTPWAVDAAVHAVIGASAGVRCAIPTRERMGVDPDPHFAARTAASSAFLAASLSYAVSDAAKIGRALLSVVTVLVIGWRPTVPSSSGA